MNVHALADACAQRPQRVVEEDRAFQQRPRDDTRHLLHHPVAHVKAAPNGRAQRLIRSDQQLFGQHCERDCKRRVKEQSRTDEERREQEERNQTEPLNQIRQHIKSGEVREH